MQNIYIYIYSLKKIDSSADRKIYEAVEYVDFHILILPVLAIACGGNLSAVANRELQIVIQKRAQNTKPP